MSYHSKLFHYQIWSAFSLIHFQSNYCSFILFEFDGQNVLMFIGRSVSSLIILSSTGLCFWICCTTRISTRTSFVPYVYQCPAFQSQNHLQAFCRRRFWHTIEMGRGFDDVVQSQQMRRHQNHQQKKPHQRLLCYIWPRSCCWQEWLVPRHYHLQRPVNEH